jgi:putative transposase
MLVLEAKLKGKQSQYNLIDEAIRTALFIRNKALRHWMDNGRCYKSGNPTTLATTEGTSATQCLPNALPHKDVGKNDLQKLCAVLAKEFDFADKLNSMARQASADRAWFAIKRFYDNCKAKKPGKKGFPQFKKRGHSVEYKTSGWKLSTDKKYISFSDGFNIGRLKLVGTRDLSFYSIKQIKRVRIVKRADGYYCQFCVDIERKEQRQRVGDLVGIDLGLEFFYTDSEGRTVENPRLLRKSEKSLKRKQRKASKSKKGSSNRRKAVKKLAKKHLKVSRTWLKTII